MDTLKIQYLDYRYLLVENYKNLGLNEQELVVLLLIDNVEKEKPTLVTSDQLALKMAIDEKEIDKILVSLLERKFLSYITLNDIMVLSIQNTKERIIELIKRDLLLSPSSDLLKNKEEELTKIYKCFEEKMKRTLTSIEFDAIHSWLQDGVKEELILEALNECALNNKYVTIKAVDKLIIKKLTSNDRKKEGYSIVDEHNKKDIDEMIEIASYDWMHD